MLVKIFRVFWGGYIADQQKLNDLKYVQMRLPKYLQIATHPNHGFGRIEGFVRQEGEPYPNLVIQVFKRIDKTLLWETRTKSNGQFKFRNISKGMDCYVMVFDPNKEKNAKVKDLIVAR